MFSFKEIYVTLKEENFYLFIFCSTSWLEESYLPDQELNLGPPMKAWSPNHRTAREFSDGNFF